MNNNLNKSVLDKILNCIPENIKPVNYLMDIFLPTDGRLTLLEHTPKGRSVEISISEFRPGALNPVSG